MVGTGTTATALLDGFTITAGNANNVRGRATDSGGGMYNSSSSPTLGNCTFSGNSGMDGGGISNVSSSSPALTNCTFRGNWTGSSGGGMDNVYSSPTLTNCVFSGNSAYNCGGGMSNTSSSPTLGNCTFSGNSARDGGGMLNFSYSSPVLTNCTFSANLAGGAGGGMHNDLSFPTLTNCIVWGAGGSPIYDDSSAPVITYSDIQGGYAGTGNIDTDPLFVHNSSPGADGIWGTVDDDYGDLRLQARSPCIDAGGNAAVPANISTDLAGNPRFVDVPGLHDPGAIVDIGAYEYQYPPLLAASSIFLFSAALPTVKVNFNAAIAPSSLTAADLKLVNLTSGQTIDCGTAANVTYDPGTLSAAWSFTGLLPDGNYWATLPAGSVSDAASNLLTNDFSFSFFALAGDANHDRAVDISDLGILATNWQQSPRNSSQGDFNYDGIVDISDLGILATSWQKTLPAPAAPETAAPAGRFSGQLIHAPATSQQRRTARVSLASEVIQ